LQSQNGQAGILLRLFISCYKLVAKMAKLTLLSPRLSVSHLNRFCADLKRWAAS